MDAYDYLFGKLGLTGMEFCSQIYLSGYRASCSKERKIVWGEYTEVVFERNF